MIAILERIAAAATPWLIDSLLGVLSGGLGLLFAGLHRKNKSAFLETLLFRASTIVDHVVRELEQTVVKEAKALSEDGKLDEADARRILQLARDRVVEALGEDAKHIAPSLITSMIESTVNRFKR